MIINLDLNHSTAYAVNTQRVKSEPELSQTTQKCCPTASTVTNLGIRAAFLTKLSPLALLSGISTAPKVIDQLREQPETTLKIIGSIGLGLLGLAVGATGIFFSIPIAVSIGLTVLGGGIMTAAYLLFESAEDELKKKQNKDSAQSENCQPC